MTVYSPPEEMKAPEFDLTIPFDEQHKREQKWLSRFKEWCIKNGKGPYKGKLITECVADGKAMYMVLSLRPCILIHLPLGDAYQSRWAHRWTASDVKQMVEREEALNELFASKEEI